MFLIKFQFLLFNKTALHIACENNNVEILKLLLRRKTIDVNARYIFN